jgi:hypothetical protein
MIESLPLEEKMMEKFRRLPASQQQEALRFVEFLEFSSLSLEDFIANIRARTDEVDPNELNSLVEEARQDYYETRNRAS